MDLKKAFVAGVYRVRPASLTCHATLQQGRFQCPPRVSESRVAVHRDGKWGGGTL